MCKTKVEPLTTEGTKLTAIARARALQQTPFVLWFTGLSGAGKTTTAEALEHLLFQQGYKTFLLDGDVMRGGLCGDLTFTEQDRSENLRRIAEVAKILFDAGLIVLVATISPKAAQRNFARSLFADGQFIEVFVETPLSVCEQRDPKGLYRQARAGQLDQFTGLDACYETPQAPELVINTASQPTAALAESLLLKLPLRQN